MGPVSGLAMCSAFVKSSLLSTLKPVSLFNPHKSPPAHAALINVREYGAVYMEA
jgi:hypothetical protein